MAGASRPPRLPPLLPALLLLLLPPPGARSQPPPVLVATPLTPQVTLSDHITGFGVKYYAVDLPVTSVLDAVLVVDRGYNTEGPVNISEVCRGWSMYMTVNNTPPDPHPQAIEREPIDFGELFLAGLVQMQQQSVMCNAQSSAKWSVKAAERGRWWVMVQTRGGAEQYANSTCRYGLWVNHHSRASTLWGGSLAAACFVLWLGWTLVVAFLPALQPAFRVYRPPVLLHEFLARLPADVLCGCVQLLWRLLRILLCGLCRRPRLGAGLRAGVSDEEDHPEVAILVDPPEPIVAPEFVSAHATGDGDGASKTADSISGTPDHPPGLAEGPTTPSIRSDDGGEPEDDTDSCRICGDTAADEPLIEPCACQGSMRYVHPSCLDKWRRESLSSGRVQNAVRCEVCNTPFQIVRAPVTCRQLCRLATAALARLAYYAAAYALGLYLWATLVRHTIVRGSCLAPYDSVAPGLRAEHWVLGVVYYGVAASHLYLCIFWQWLRWLNTLPISTPDAPAPQFGTLRNVAFVAYFFGAFVVTELGAGYLVKYLFYLFADTMIWIWDLPLTIGFMLVFFCSLFVSMVLVVRESVGYLAPMLGADLGVVLSRPRL